MKKKRIVKICAAVFILIVFIIQYDRFKQKTQYIPSGISGDEVSFGMTFEEVYDLLGEPDGEYQWKDLKDSVWDYNKNFYGHDALVSYTFDNVLNDPSAQIDEIYLGFTFANEEECARAMQIICQSLSEEYSKYDGASEGVTEGRATVGPRQLHEREDLILIYKIGAKYQSVLVYQYPMEIQIFPHRKNLPKHFLSWLFTVIYWF